METIEKQDSKRCRMFRRARVGAVVAVGTVAAGSGTTFAAPPTADETAGAAIEDLADRGVAFMTTYALPAVIAALGIGLVIALVRRVGKKIAGSF